MKIYFLLATILMAALLLPEPCSASTVNAASCSYSDVSAAINQAQYNDLVMVPSGDCVWNRTLQISKGISLQGAGIDRTIIRSDGPNGTSASSYTLFFYADQETAINDHPFELSGFTFTQVSAVYSSLTLSNQDITHALTRVRVHDNKFIGRAGGGIGVLHNLGVFGVVYNNTFQDISHSWRFLGGSAGWNSVEEWVPGTGNAMYYENNYGLMTIDREGLIVSGGGGNRYVARYNTNNMSVRGPSKYIGIFDIHGNQENNPTAGIGNEIYGNHLIGTSGTWIGHRGGQVFFFFNRWSNTSGRGSFTIQDEFNDDAYMSVQCPEGGLYPRTAAGNCVQRPRNSYYWRNFGGLNGTILSNSLNIQFDHYHRYDGILNDPLTLFENDGWFRDNTAAFDGTIAPVGSCGFYSGSACTRSGVGCGTLAKMNAITPAAPGLGFWVTEQNCTELSGMVGRNPANPVTGTLYRAEGNRWVAYYTPYIYPHPLTVAPMDAAICGEGSISGECWCQGLKTYGYCCHGYHQAAECTSYGVSVPAESPHIYVAQNAAGSDSGSDCANAHSVAWFNNASSWGNASGKIGPGDTVHLCGKINASIRIQGSGQPGDPITLLFEKDAALSAPYWEDVQWGIRAAIFSNARSNIVIDGGINGLIEATSSGTPPAFGGSMPYNFSNAGVRIYGGNAVEVKNLKIEGMYRRAPLSGDRGGGEGISVDGCINQTRLHHNVISEANTGISVNFRPGMRNVFIHDNSISRISNGITVGSANTGCTVDGVDVHDNNITDGYVWDGIFANCTGDCWFHNDGIQFWAVHANSSIANSSIYNNHIYGDMGRHITGWIFTEGNVVSERIYNNVLESSGTSYPANGYIVVGRGDRIIAHNTINGDGKGEGMLLSGPGNKIYNNIFYKTPQGIATRNASYLEESDNNIFYGMESGRSMIIVNAQGTWVGYSFSQWQGFGYDVHSRVIDPGFWNAAGRDYHLNGASPAIDAAKDLSTYGFSSDKDNQTRPQGAGWDIGAFEFVGPYHRADANDNGCLELSELLAFITRWKLSNMDVTLREIIEALGLWKRGC